MRQILLLSILLCYASGCTPEDDERCGGPTYWNDEYKSCLPVEEAGDAGDTEVEILPTGLGDPCTNLGVESECAGSEAEYCVLQPGKPTGYCSVHDCTTAPDNCPSGYKCCDITVASMPNICVTSDDYFLMGSTCIK